MATTTTSKKQIPTGTINLLFGAGSVVLAILIVLVIAPGRVKQVFAGTPSEEKPDALVAPANLAKLPGLVAPSSPSENNIAVENTEEAVAPTTDATATTAADAGETPSASSSAPVAVATPSTVTKPEVAKPVAGNTQKPSAVPAATSGADKHAKYKADVDRADSIRDEGKVLFDKAAAMTNRKLANKVHDQAVALLDKAIAMYQKVRDEDPDYPDIIEKQQTANYYKYGSRKLTTTE